MIKTVLVDDEKPALIKLQSLLSAYPDYEVCGSFTDAREALNQIPVLEPMVVFLDIAMPGISGLELASALHQKLGNQLQIIFVSAYDEYALSAFEVWPTDYLLKPVSRARFEQTILRVNEVLRRNSALTQAPAVEETPMVRLFGKLEISGAESFSNNWRTAKVRELFAFFMHNRTRGIYRDSLLETLWPEMPPEKALASLNTCNYYLRRHVEKSGVGISLLYEAGYYRISLNGISCDADLFIEAEEQSQNITDKNLPSILAGVELYRGRYFEDVKCTWADLDRERFAAACVNIRMAVANYYFEHGQFDAAADNATHALGNNTLHMGAWKLLLDAYRQMGDPVRLKHAMSNMRRIYLEQTGHEPNELI